jgi:hypothetical protein
VRIRSVSGTSGRESAIPPGTAAAATPNPARPAARPSCGLAMSETLNRLALLDSRRAAARHQIPVHIDRPSAQGSAVNRRRRWRPPLRPPASRTMPKPGCLSG